MWFGIQKSTLLFERYFIHVRFSNQTQEVLFLRFKIQGILNFSEFFEAIDFEIKFSTKRCQRFLIHYVLHLLLSIKVENSVFDREVRQSEV